MIKLKLSLAALAIAATGQAHAGDVDFATYAQSPAALSAIASAVASAGGCSIPLEFDETVGNGERMLGVHCRGNADDEFSAFVRFLDDGFSLLPLGFEYAG
ncbi:MAG: hypothetical protein AAF382_04915 [Pseudomonadota bacterium]